MTTSLLQRHPTLRRHVRESPPGEAVGLASSDGRWGIEVAVNLRGVRDLGALALQLARWLAVHPSKRAALVVAAPRLTPQMDAEWSGMLQVLRADVARRMSLFAPDHAASSGTPPWLRPVLEALRPALEPTAPAGALPSAPTAKLFDVLKLLLHRWLLHEGPIRVLALAEQAGCSYPTVFKALSRLDGYGELTRTSRRSVMLSDFPDRTWGELLALLPALRRTTAYVDASGRSFAPDWYLARLKQQMPPRIAISGVQAARHWHRAFDLNGIPRIDLVMHVPGAERADLSFVTEIDAALRPMLPDARRTATPVLVVHQLSRRASLFTPDSRKGLPIADPVETLLDLHDLRLDRQAEEMIRFLTERGRHGA